MNKINPKVDKYFIEGCGRCSLWKTPECKVNFWQKELKLLRQLLLDCGLTEALKWSQPCYTLEKKNIVLMSAFKEYCALSFIKGSLLKDPNNILISPGENSQATRQIRFTNAKTITMMKPILKTYIQEAIEIEKAGLKVNFKKNHESIPEELQSKFAENPAFRKSFEGLTPGRQRGYILYFSAAKQAKTRQSRIEKYLAKILDGKGLND